MGRRLLALCISLLLGLVAIEVGFRLFGPRPFARPQIIDDEGEVVDLSNIIGFFRQGDLAVPDEPRNGIQPGLSVRLCYDRPGLDYFDEQGCVTVSINDLGFRDDSFPMAKPDGEYRVLAIGDSFTFAQGCRAEDGWTEVLERLLGEQGEEPVQVMNAGFTGGGSWPQEYAPWVIAHALAFEPDRVVYGMCLNDMDRRVPMLAWTKVGDDTSALGDPWLGGWSVGLNYLQLQRRRRQLFEARPPNIGRLITTDPVPWEANKSALRAIHEHLAAAGVPFTIAVFPMLSLLGDDYPYGELHTSVADFCSVEGIDMVDLYAPFHGLQDRALWVHPFDQHPNPTAHRLFAEGIFAHLQPR